MADPHMKALFEVSYICFALKDLKLKLETLNRVSMKPFPLICYIPFLLDPSPEVREKAIENLIRLPPSQAIPLLIDIIATSHELKHIALYTLSYYPTRIVIPFLKKAFEIFPGTVISCLEHLVLNRPEDREELSLFFYRFVRHEDYMEHAFRALTRLESPIAVSDALEILETLKGKYIVREIDLHIENYLVALGVKEGIPQTPFFSLHDFLDRISFSPRKMLRSPHLIYLAISIVLHRRPNYSTEIIEILSRNPTLQLFLPAFFSTPFASQALKAIEKTRNPFLIPFLARLVLDEKTSPTLVNEALVILSRYRNPELLPLIFSRFDALSGTFTDTIVQKCLPFFRKFSRQILPLIVPYLSHPDLFYRAAAFEALMVLRTPDFVPHAVKALESDNSYTVKFAAAAYLVKVKEKTEKIWDLLRKNFAPEEIPVFAERYPFVLLYMPVNFFVELPEDIRKLVAQTAVKRGFSPPWLIFT